MLDRGANEVLVKPVDPAQLAALAEQTISRARMIRRTG